MESLYLSHGANGKWFIVEPRDSPAMAISSLLGAGRTVCKVSDLVAWQEASSGREARQRARTLRIVRLVMSQRGPAAISQMIAKEVQP